MRKSRVIAGTALLAALVGLAVPSVASAAPPQCVKPSPAAAAIWRATPPIDYDALLVLGREDFRAARYDDAAARLHEVALQHPDHAIALEATKLYLDALNQLASKQARPACFDDIERVVPALREKHCSESSADRDGEACILLAAIASDVDRLNAQRIVEQADKLPPGSDAAKTLFVKGGAAFLDAFRVHCNEPSLVRREVHGSLRSCTESVYNGARSFGAAHLSAKAITAHRLLVAFDERTKAHSPLALKSVYEVGELYRGIGVYDLAAEWLERYASLAPAADRADVALSDAFILRLGLGDDTAAARDAATFAKTYGQKKRVETASIALALAGYYGDHEQWDRVASVITTSRSMLDRAPLDLTVRAHVLLAHAYRKSTSPERAAVEYANIRAMWRDPSAATQAIQAAWPAEDRAQHDRRLARTLIAVGEAMFEGADARRQADVETLKFPVFQGTADRAAILAHIQTKVRPWYEKKLVAITLVEAEYVKVLGVQPMPPPTWVIASAAAVGTMWSDLVDDFSRVPIPDVWRKTPALYHAYWDAMDSMTEVIKAQHAKPAMKKCLDLASKFQVIDPRARLCEVWLAKSYKSEFHVTDEILPAFRAPDLSNVTAAARSSPLREPSSPPAATAFTLLMM